MALIWDFKKDLVGTVSRRNPAGDWVTWKLYDGNAYMIMISEDPANDTYQLCDFWADWGHCKRCLDNPAIIEHYRGSVWTLDGMQIGNAGQLARLLVRRIPGVVVNVSYADKEGLL